MTKDEAMKIAHEYAKQYHVDCDIILYAGKQSDWHFVWLKNSKTARYSGLGCAINISESGDVSEISSGIEINEIRKNAIRLKQTE